MNSGNKIVFFLGSLGVFNGLILAIYFILFTSKKHFSNYLLGALLLVLCIRIGKSVAFFFDYNLPKIYLQIGLTACFFIGPFLYFYIKSEIRQVRRLPKNWLWVLIFWFVFIVCVGGAYSYEAYPSLWRGYFIPLIYVQWGFHIAFSIILLIPVIKKAFRKESLKLSEKWSLSICGIVLVLFVCYVWAILNITKGSYINASLLFSLSIYLAVFVLLYRRAPLEVTPFSSEKYAGNKLNDDDAQLMIEKIKRAVEEKKLFKNPNLKVNDLAREINVSGHRISQVLNDNFDKNFTLFINEYRINEACLLLLENRNLTIDAVGDEVGFNAKSTFFAAFKKIKGVTPGVYQQSNTPDL